MEKETPFWSVAKVTLVKLKQQRCSCAILPIWVGVLQLKDGQLNNKFWNTIRGNAPLFLESTLAKIIFFMEVEKYKLGNPRSFHYLNQSNCYEFVGVNDAHEYLATRRAMDIVGICAQEQDAIFCVVASILHIGNIDFVKGKEIDSSVFKDGKSKFHLSTTAELLMCDPQGLEDALCKHAMITPEEVIKRRLDSYTEQGRFSKEIIFPFI